MLQKSIVFISDVTSGGAAKACRLLFSGVRRDARFSAHWVAATGSMAGVDIASEWPSLTSLALYRLVLRLTTKESSRRKWASWFNEANVLPRVMKHAPYCAHVHGLHEGMSFGLMRALPRSLPIVLTLHDMWPLTGYCYYSFDCVKLMTGCAGVCPELGRCGVAVLPPDVEWRQRTNFILRNRNRIVMVSPSKWLAQIAEERFDGLVDVRHIPGGVDTDIYIPLNNKNEIRRLLGLPQDRYLILTGAPVVTDRRKGFAYLKEAIAGLDPAVKAQVCVAAFGAETPPQLDVEFRALGYIRDERLLNLYYNASDLFVLPSLAESFGLVFAEAMAAGTPCVAFDYSGCAEVVRNNETGMLAKYKDADSLGRCLEQMMRLPADQVRALSRRARELVVNEYSIELQSKRHLDLYASLQVSAE